MRFRREVDVPWSLLAPFRLDVWGFPWCRRGFKHFRLKGNQKLKVRNARDTFYLHGENKLTDLFNQDCSSIVKTRIY